MLKLLNVAAITMLVGSAAWAYQTKYETIFFAEQVKKLEARVEKEKEQIAILQAEWQHLNRPVRMEQLAEQYAADLKPIKPVQIARAQDLPERSRNPVDQIASKLDGALLTTGSIGKPVLPRSTSASVSKAAKIAATPIPKAPKLAATPIPRPTRTGTTPAPASPRAAMAPMTLTPPKTIRRAVAPAPTPQAALRPNAAKPVAR